MGEYTTSEIDRRFRLLDQYERRCVVHFLRETEAGQAPVEEVVSVLQKQGPTPTEADRIETALHHNHLPYLTDLDVVDFDSRSGTVRYRGDALVEALLDATPEMHLPGP